MERKGAIGDAMEKGGGVETIGAAMEEGMREVVKERVKGPELIVELWKDGERQLNVSLGLRHALHSTHMKEVVSIIDRALQLKEGETALLTIKNLGIQLPRGKDPVLDIIYQNNLPLEWRVVPKIEHLPPHLIGKNNKDPFCVVIGRRGSGRTTMLQQLARQLVLECEERNVLITVFDPLAIHDPLVVGKKWCQATRVGGKKVSAIVYPSFNPDAIDEVFNGSDRERHAEQEAYRGPTSLSWSKSDGQEKLEEHERLCAAQRKAAHQWRKRRGTKRIVVLDNCMVSNRDWKTDTIRRLAMNGRCCRISALASVSTALDIPPMIRGNVDLAFAFRENHVNNLRKLYENFFGMFPTFREFRTALDTWIEPHNYAALVAVNTVNSNKIGDTVFRFNAFREQLFPTSQTVKLMSSPPPAEAKKERVLNRTLLKEKKESMADGMPLLIQKLQELL